MIRKRTFIDARVLIAAARGDDVPSMIALKIPDDQSREFAVPRMREMIMAARIPAAEALDLIWMRAAPL